MATIYKGVLSLGLVTIPVKVSVAARTTAISFNMLHKRCGSRITMKTWCPECDKEIERKDTDKGYEYSKGEYLTVTAEELADCAPESSRTIEIKQCVPACDVDPILFESSYYLEPEPSGVKGYKLLVEALTVTRQYAIASITMSGREHVIIIRPYQGVLAFHTMYYEAELRAVPSVPLNGVDIKPTELALAKQLLEVHSADFEHGNFADGYGQAVEQLLEAKQQGKKPKAVARKPARSAPGDLMEALAASLSAKTIEMPKRGDAKRGAMKRRSA